MEEVCFPFHTDKDGSIFLSLRSNGMTSRSRNPVGSFRINNLSSGLRSRDRNSVKVPSFSWRNLGRIVRVQRTGKGVHRGRFLL